MSLISYTPLADGVTAVNAAATNTPLSTIYNDYNGNITDANIASSAAIAFSKISGGSATALGAWQAYTPTFTNLTVGNGTLTATYTQIGKTVIGRVMLVFGTTTSLSGALTLTLPVTSVNYTNSNSPPIGAGRIIHAGTTAYSAQLFWLSTTTMKLQVHLLGSTYLTYAETSSTIPATWANLDIVAFSFTYEAA